MRKILLPPVIFFLCIIGIVGVNYLSVTGLVLISGPVKFIGYAMMVVGIFLPIWGARIFRQHHTNIIPYKNPDRMVTEGPFRLSRNPMYLGMLLTLIGLATLYGTALSFVFPLLYFFVASLYYIPFEEERMIKAFGDDFIAYKAKVRRWI